MATDTIEKLYEEYQLERNAKISKEQFTSFVVFFPSLLVIISDGVVDMEEWEYLQQLSLFMAKSFKKEGDSAKNVNELSKCYLMEVSYIIKHLKDYQDDFLLALKSYLEENPEDKVSVFDTIKLFADASNGTSTEEEEKIESIANYLQLD